MDVVLTGSIAFDYIMHFPGRFREHILPDHLDSLSLSFLVDTLDRRRGGVAANIGYSLALLGERPRIMATVGEDFAEYREFLESVGVDTAEIKTVPGVLTASFFVTTDNSDAQIASFYTGGMANAKELRFVDLDPLPELVMISPNDPVAMNAYAAECTALGVPYFYDPSQQILRLSGDELQRGIEGCVGLFVNDYELALIEEKTGMESQEIVARTSFTVVTRGEHGSTLYQDGDRHQIPAVKPEIAAEPTGVGDAYRGGFLKGYVHGQPIECCCMLGALAATYCLEHLGPQGHRFELSEFSQRFRQEFGEACDSKSLFG
jgi:adenosine kinase